MFYHYQGEKLGKGGLDLTPSDERAAPAPPERLSFEVAANPETLSTQYTNSTIVRMEEEGSRDHRCQDEQFDSKDGLRNEIQLMNGDACVESSPAPKLLPRETGHDIGMGSPVPLSAEMVGIITRLRNMKVCACVSQALPADWSVMAVAPLCALIIYVDRTKMRIGAVGVM